MRRSVAMVCVMRVDTRTARPRSHAAAPQQLRDRRRLHPRSRDARGRDCARDPRERVAEAVARPRTAGEHLPRPAARRVAEAQSRGHVCRGQRRQPVLFVRKAVGKARAVAVAVFMECCAVAVCARGTAWCRVDGVRPNSGRGGGLVSPTARTRGAARQRASRRRAAAPARQPPPPGDRRQRCQRRLWARGNGAGRRRGFERHGYAHERHASGTRAARARRTCCPTYRSRRPLPRSAVATTACLPHHHQGRTRQSPSRPWPEGP